MIRTLLLLTATLLTGCQTYRPAPLDLAAHEQAWQQRDPASPRVAEYARRLNSPPDAKAFDPSDGLSLAEARVVALFFNPELRVARLRARVKRAGAAEAGRWEDPVLRVDAERIIDSVAHPWVVGGVLDFTLPLSGTKAAEKALAGAEADAAVAAALLEERRVLVELDRAWTELALLEQRIELAESFTKDLSAAVEQAEQLQKAGEMGALEAGLFRLERGRRRAELQSLAPRHAAQLIAVRTLMGLSPTAPVELQVSLPVARFADGRSTAQERRSWVVANHPRLLQARHQYDVAERSLALEIRRQFPDLAIGGGFGRDEGTDRILGGLAIPIPILNANRRAIAEARAERDVARAAAESQYEMLASELAQAEAALEAAQLRRQLLQSEVAPLIDEQLRAARQLQRVGTAEPVVVFETLTRAQDTRLELLEAAAAEAAAVNQLNDLLRPVTDAVPTKEEPR